VAKREHHTGTLALIAGGGALAWLLLHGGGRGLGGGGTPSEPTPPPGPCRLRLDSRALQLDGHDVATDDAIASCRASGRAEVLVTGDAIAGVADQLVAALKSAGVDVVIVNPARH
jgi:hypothetical protein